MDELAAVTITLEEAIEQTADVNPEFRAALYRTEDAVADGYPPRMRLDRLLFLRPVPAGMDWAVVGHFVARMRKTTDPVPPVKLRPITGTPFFRVLDGRHRCVAAVMAGRDGIEYEIQFDDSTKAS